MRSTLTLLAVLPLAGCRLFQSAAIPTTCEDLPGKCGTVDTDPGTDDTYDTAPWIPEPTTSLGMVLCSLSGDQIWLRAVAPGDEVVKEAHFEAENLRPGAVAYDPENDRLYLWDDGASVLWLVGGGGEVVSIDSTTDDSTVGQIFDMQLFEGSLYLVADTALWRWTPGSDGLERMATTTTFHLLRGVFPAFSDNLFLLDLGADDAPDLFRVTVSSAESRLSFEDFDSETGRATSGFLGPASKPHVCSSVGAVYAVEDLNEGENSPLAFPDQDALAAEFDGAEIAQETSDCAWDDGVERFLIHSRRLGVLALDPWGHFDILARPDTDEEFIQASFFQPTESDE